MWTTGRHLPFIQVPVVTFIQNTPVRSKKRHHHVEIMNLQMHSLPFLGVFVGCWRVVVMGIKAEGMLTRASPDHQPTCFNIHDITSSQGGPGLHAAGCSYWKKTGYTLCSVSLSLSLASFLPLSTVIGCSYCNFKITLFSVIWTDLDSWTWPLQSLWLFRKLYNKISNCICLHSDSDENTLVLKHWSVCTNKGYKSMLQPFFLFGLLSLLREAPDSAVYC